MPDHDWDHVVGTDPHTAAELTAQGRACNARKDYDAAVRALDSAIGLEPGFAAAFNARGFAYNGKKLAW